MIQVAEKHDACVEVRFGDDPPRRFPLESDHALIGRSENADVVLDSKQVSRVHAELVRDPFGRWWVRDLGSRNGVRVNNTRVKEQVLQSGDVIRIWRFEMVFQIVPNTPAAPPEDPPNSAIVSAADPVQILTATDMEPVKIDASHLQKLMDVGNRLMEIENGLTRLKALCRLMVSKNFRGRIAAALRMRKDAKPDDPVQMLCEAESPFYPRKEISYISRGVLRSIRQSESSVLASNVTSGGDVVGLSISAEIEPMSAVACTVRSTARLMDVLYVVLPPEYGTPEWLALAMLAVKQYQQADMAWASRRQAQTQAVIAGEIERAQTLQQRLLPRELDLPGLELAVGFQPCRWVGGDYIDAVPTPDGRVFMIVADVSGKGLPAALVTSSLHTMVHASLSAQLGVRDLINNLNRYLCETLPETSFVTALAIMIDPRTGEMNFVNAGHLPAVIIGPRGEFRRAAAGDNLPLGIETAPLTWQQDKLDRGEMIALFTDGITDLAPQGGPRGIGIDAFAQHLADMFASSSTGTPLRELAERLDQRLDALRGPHMAIDDRTFLLARLR